MKPGAESGTEEKPPKPKRSWLMGCAMTALLFLCALLIAGSCWSCHVGKETARLSSHVEELMDELRAELPEVASEDDAAPFYLQAFTLHQWPPWATSGRKPSAEELGRYILNSSAYANTLRLATAKPACSLALRGFDPDQAVVGMPDFRRAAEFFDEAARYELLCGKSDKALGLLGVALRIAHDAPFPLHVVGPHFKEQQFEPRICDGLKLALGDSEVDAASVQSFLVQIEWYLAKRPHAAQSFRLAKLRSLAAVEDIASGKEQSLKPMGCVPAFMDGQFRRALWRGSGLLPAEARRLEEAFDLAIAASDKPFGQAAAETSATDRKFFCHLPSWALRTRLDMPDMWPRPGFPEVLTEALTRHTQDLACLQEIRIALACRLYRVKFGAYPESLAELSAKLPEHFKELPADPFTGKPFIYKRTATGCMIWSVGMDRADDGGDDKKDIVFELKK